MVGRLAALCFVAIALIAAPVRADRGDTDHCAAPLEPAVISLSPGGLEAPRSACTASTDTARVRLVAGVGDQGFAEALEASLFVHRRWLTRAGLELELGARLVRGLSLEGQDLSSDSFELGPIVVGVANGEATGWFGLRGRWTAQLRAEIPRTDTSDEVTAIRASPAFTWTAAATDTIHLHSRLAMLLSSTPGTRPLTAEASGVASIDGSVLVTPWLAFTGGVAVQTALDESALDHVLVRGGLRAGSSWQLHLSGGAPVAGDETAAAVFVLGVTRRR